MVHIRILDVAGGRWMLITRYPIPLDTITPEAVWPVRLREIDELL